MDELLQEHLESVHLRAGVAETPLLGVHVELALGGGQELLVKDPLDRHLVHAGPLVGLDKLAGVLDEAVHKDGLDARVEPNLPW